VAGNKVSVTLPMSGVAMEIGTEKENSRVERVGGRVGKSRVAASILGPWRPQSIGRGDILVVVRVGEWNDGAAMVPINISRRARTA
jgi:hypothetical protein